jgi:hypothetical protein
MLFGDAKKMCEEIVKSDGVSRPQQCHCERSEAISRQSRSGYGARLSSV